MKATYSPEDNKIRIYPDERLPADLYDKIKSAGYGWAPKQKLFVAPMWTPNRHDIALELCGGIEDEDATLIERAEVRADRFEGYEERRIEDAERATNYADKLTGGVDGDSIVIGHHRNDHAERQAKKVKNALQRAVNMWETADYWKRRANGVLRNVNYKDKPEVRARRIKGLEADKRKRERQLAENVEASRFWSAEGLTLEKALNFTNYNHMSFEFTLEKYPRNLPASQYEGTQSLWFALKDGIVTVEQARDLVLPITERRIAYISRWINHYELRIQYERDLLDEQGKIELLAPKPRSATRAALPICNYMAADGLTIPHQYHHGDMVHYPMIAMTKAEYAKINADYKGTRIVEGSHRVRVAMIRQEGRAGLAHCAVFLSDSKTHEPPHAKDVAPKTVPEPVERNYTPPVPDRAQAMRDTLRAGVEVVTANQLFPTPRHIAERMVRMLDVQPGDNVLEPSAGTGVLLGALGGKMFSHNPERGSVSAIEINNTLARKLQAKFPLTTVYCADFLEYTGEDLILFDRIIMNPPFENASDIKHILHAMGFLKPGGRLVAICANGSRQNETLRQHAATWEELPAGTFEGTNVSSVLLTIDA
jgi:phospholipid N-methyltransferase